jgi:hypothetical protein
MASKHRSLLVALSVGVAFASGGSGRALERTSNDPRAILQAALDTQNPNRASSRMKMSIRDRAGTRERWMTVRSMRFEGGRKSLILIEQPADVRNTGFLSIDYTARAKADEQWLYLPKLHRVSRVPASGKADGFVGSDFSVSDLAGPDPDSFQAQILEPSVKVGDDECWSIEATPRDDAARDAFGYSKVQLWVSKDKLLILQLKATTADGKRTKYLKATDVQKEGGRWTPHRLQMRTVEGTNVISETVIDVLSVDNTGADVVEGDFTQQRLERGV